LGPLRVRVRPPARARGVLLQAALQLAL